MHLYVSSIVRVLMIVSFYVFICRSNDILGMEVLKRFNV